MAAFSKFPLFVPGTRSQGASVFSTRRRIERRSTLFAATAARVAAVAGEIVLFLWMVLPLAFSLLVMAGFFM